MLRYLGLLIFFVPSLSNSVLAQDIHLSQYFTNQQNLNPATSGMYEGRYRIVANHRSQWAQIGSNPLVTSIAAFDQKYHLGNDVLNLGILVLRDQFQSYSMNTDKLHLTGAYQKDVQGHQLRAGLQFGFTFKNTDFGNQTFPNQWVYEQGEFDQGVSNQEVSLLESHQFFDLNLGLAWSTTIGKYRPTAGISVFHVNTPTDSYFNNSNSKLASRYVFHADVEFNLKPDLRVTPQILYMRARTAQNMMIGGLLRKDLQNLGVWEDVFWGIQYRDGFARTSDAIIPMAGISFKNFQVGVSYDFNISELSEFGGNKSTFEMSLIYTAPEFLPRKMTLPCDRF